MKTLLEHVVDATHIQQLELFTLINGQVNNERVVSLLKAGLSTESFEMLKEWDNLFIACSSHLFECTAAYAPPHMPELAGGYVYDIDGQRFTIIDLSYILRYGFLSPEMLKGNIKDTLAMNQVYHDLMDCGVLKVNSYDVVYDGETFQICDLEGIRITAINNRQKILPFMKYDEIEILKNMVLPWECEAYVRYDIGEWGDGHILLEQDNFKTAFDLLATWWHYRLKLHFSTLALYLGDDCAHINKLYECLCKLSDSFITPDKFKRTMDEVIK